jgi:hypothetical protein
MADTPAQPTWWELHLRHARGEVLSAAEQARYEAEMAALDKGPPPSLEALRRLREEVKASGLRNAELRQRVAQLEEAIREAEQSLSPATREALGIGD